MNNIPLKHKEVAAILAEYIAKTSPCCPIPDSAPVLNCECWGSDYCKTCIRKNAEYLKRE